MGNYINPGEFGFKRILNGAYVDKTEMIKIINERIDTTANLICTSRPRRFGKSFAAKMLCAYYDASCDSHNLFDDLNIANDPDYKKYLNQFNVIYLDITNFISRFKRSEKPIGDVPQEIVNELETEVKLLYPETSKEPHLSAMLKKCVELTGRRFIFIIDEWDAVIREAKNDSVAQERYLSLLREWFKNGNYTADIVAAAYMTGILPIKKDGSQSAISEFQEFSVLKPRMFGTYVGFTEDEVRNLCDEYDCDFEQMKHWYDGYQIQNVGSVYNPNSVMQAIQNREFDSYWRKTSAEDSLLVYIDMDENGLQSDVLNLISGNLVEVNTRGFKNDLQTFADKHDVLTLLIHLGYLSFEEVQNSIGVVRIPNEEIRLEFQDMLRRGKHPELVKVVKASDQLLKDTIAGNEQAVVKVIEQVRNTNYAATFYNNEQALRYVLKMAYISRVDQYLKIEELPSGHGLADLVFLPKKYSPLPAMVVELKWNRDTDSALEQIKKRNYPSVLREYGGELLLVGINYDEKTKEHTCKIEKLNAN